MLKKHILKNFTSYLIKNGRIINPDRIFDADIYIKNDKIQKIFERKQLTNKSFNNFNIDINNTYESYVLSENTIEINASNKFVIPGGIDTHTHMELPFMGEVAVDDFDTGTRAAVAGGTTTIIDFLIPENNQSLMQGFESWRKKADGRINCDYALHCILTKWNDDVKLQMKNMIDLGVQSFKVFLAYKNALMMDSSHLYQILKRSKELGSIVLVHAENGDLIDEAQKELVDNLSITGPEGHYMSRPDIFEALATHQAITVSEYLTSPLYIVHLMSKKSAREVMNAKLRGAPIFGETLAAALGADGRNMWHSDWDIAGPHVMSPPLNPDPTVKDYLMRNIHTGNIDTVGSDNCTFCLRQKKRGIDDFRKIPNGVGGIEDRLAVLWTKGVKTGLISKTEFVKSVSTNAAQIFNLYPNKGIIKEGADADVVIWNGDEERIISRNNHHQSVDFSVFEGMIVNGTAEKTFSRGKLVFDKEKGFDNLHKGKYIGRECFGYVYDRIEERSKALDFKNFKVNRDVDSNNNNTNNKNINHIYPENEEIRKLKYKLSELNYKLEKLKNSNKL